MGTIRTGLRIGGGVTFAKTARDFSKDMPKKQRRLACDSALLAKMQAGNVVVIDELNFDAPKTREFARILDNLNIDRSCLVTLSDQDINVYKSARNIFKVDVMKLAELNAGDICNKQKVLFTKDAFMALLDKKKN